jgi:MFS transporter, SP family, major inositol transporter
LGGLLFGYETGVILFISEELGLPLSSKAWWSPRSCSGGAAGAGSTRLLSDRLERRNLILIAAVTFSVGAIGTTLVPNVGVPVLFRVVLGLAIGAAALTVLLYPSEIVPTGYEGRSLP